MANNVGNISVGLSLDNQSFEAVLNGSASRLRRFEGDVGRSGSAAAAASNGVGRLSGSVSGLGSVMQSVSFGAGDFISQLGTRGIGGGLQAAANNVQQLGAAFGPMGLAISAGVGVAATALGVYIEQQDRAAKQTQNLADKNATAWKKISQDAQRGAEDWRQATRLSLGEDRAILENKGRKGFDDIKGDLGNTEQQIAEMQRKRDALAKRFNETLPEALRGAAGPGDRFAQRAGVNLPGGFRSIAEADSRSGPLFQRAIGGAANVTEGKWALERAPGWAGWLTGQKIKTFKNAPVLSPERIEALGKLEQDIIAANDALANLDRRRAALNGAMGPAFTEKRDEQRFQEAEKERLAGEKRQKALADDADEMRRRFEGGQERLDREKQRIEDLRKAGGITDEEAAKFQQRLQQPAQRQPNALPSFTAGSQETLSAINRIIRGSDTKTVEKNTATTASNTGKLVGKMDQVRQQLSQQAQIKVVRF